MSGPFEAQLEEAFQAAAADRHKTRVFKDLARQDPAQEQVGQVKRHPLKPGDGGISN